MIQPIQISARAFVLAMIVLCGLTPLSAAPPKVADSGQSVVDVIALKTGKTLRGIVAWQSPNSSLTMIVSREWLKNAYPKLEADELAETRKRRGEAWAETKGRIAERMKAAGDSPQFTFFLKQEAERLDELTAKADPDDPDFLWMDVPRDAISRVILASSEQRRICSLAWDERLSHVETRELASLTKELKTKGVDLESPAANLTDRLAARPQTADEWSARLALVEYTLKEAVDFQGMGDTLVRTGEGRTVNLAEVLPKIMQQQVGSLLKDLLGDAPAVPKPKSDADGLKSAIREAEAAKSKGFRVTRLDIDANTMRVTVETRFVAKQASDQWQTIWRMVATEDGTKPRPQAEARIEQDPQLKSAVDSLKTFGLGDTGTLQKAIRVGAATMAAQQSADAAFGEFRDRYSRHLDGPPLPPVTGQ